MASGTDQSQSAEVNALKPAGRNGVLPLVAVTLLLILISVFVAVLPHFFVYAQYGNSHFYSNFDDQIYSAIAKTAYLDGWRVREPYTRPDEGVPSLYAPLLFVPYSLVTRILNLPVEDILGVMRVMGGLMLGAALTFCLYRLLDGIRHRSFWVAICGGIFLCDVGTHAGRTIIGNFVEIVYNHKVGWPLLGDFLGQFRVAAILLCLPFLLIVAASLRDSDRLSKSDIVLAIAAFAALIYTYFYYWLAVAVLLSVLIGWIIVKNVRAGKSLITTPVWGLAAILLGGLLLGSPQIYSNAHTASQPQYKHSLERIARGQKLLPGDPIRFLHIRNYWALGKLLLAAFLMRLLRLWRLKVLWILTAIGYLLTNLAIFANIDFENHHWITVTNPIGELMILILLAYCADRYLSWPRVRWAAPVLVVLIAIPGVTLRGMGTLRAEFGKDRTAALQQVLPLEREISNLGSDCTIAGNTDQAEAVFQLSRCAMLFSTPYTALITPIPDQEVHERQALSYWLEGWTLDAYRAVAKYPMCWNSFGHPEWQPAYLIKARAEIFEKLSDPAYRQTLIARYQPTHLVITEKSGRQPVRDCEWKMVTSMNGVSIYRLMKP